MIGNKLLHYEITGHLGSGGMGEVYQATDAKLGRSVAIKILPEAFSHDADRVARLQNYFFNPDFIGDVCGELGVPWRSNGYRWSLPSRVSRQRSISSTITRPPGPARGFRTCGSTTVRRCRTGSATAPAIRCCGSGGRRLRRRG